MTLNFFRDDNGGILKGVPKKVAIEETYDATISTSTPLTLNAATKLLEITSLDKALVYKWGATATLSEFDGVVPANTSKLVPVPDGQTSIQFIEQAATAILIVVEF